tara:strand:- start:843 stop:1997 length:1155 start_codon:yes stop_codon:yes gene_type:complete
MFRGGKVIDSRGTGITSGLMDGGRVGYQPGGKVTTGGDLNPGIFGFKFDQPFLSMKTPENRFGGSLNFGQSPKDFAQALKPGSSYRNYLEELNKPEEFETEVTSTGDVKFKLDEKGNKIPIKKEDISLKEQIEKDRIEGITGKDTQGSLEAMGITVKDDGTTEFTGDPGAKKINTGPTGNKTIEPVISPEDAIRENAELFKELLGEASKEDIKKARIQDASDYLLKFFAGTQKEGADVGSAAAEVAEFAVSRDSRTDRAKEAAKKTDQTATALAINDYIAGKRSKEEINKLLAGYAAKAEFAKGDTASQIADFAGKQGYLPGVDIIKTYIRDDKALSGKEIVEFDSSEQKVEYSPGDENRIYIDTKTKQVFTFNKDKIRIPISG